MSASAKGDPVALQHPFQRKNGENVNPISEHRLVSSQLGRAMNWVDRLRTVQMSRCCLDALLSCLHDELLQGLVVPH